MKRDNFVFHGEWVTAISRLPNDVRLELYDAIVQYGTTGEEPTLKSMVRVAFDFVQPTLDIDREKYRAMCVRNKVNRTKSCNKLSQVVTSGDELSQVGSNNSNSNSNNNSNNKEENNTKEEPPKRGKKKDALSSCTHKTLELLEKREEKFYESLQQYVKTYGKDMVRAFFDYWTEKNKNQSKMRFEDEKFFDIPKRLATWAARDSAFNTNKGKQDNSQTDAIIQQQREDESKERNRRYDEMRRNAVSYADARQSDEYQRALREN